VLVDGEWYKCGFTKPKCNKGDEVSFTYTEGTYGKEIDVKAGALSVTSGGSAAPAASAPPSGALKNDAPRPSYGGKGVFPIPALDGQRAIVRQNSLTNAVNLFKDAVSADKKATDAAIADRIIAVARMFEAYSCGDLDLGKAVAMKTKKEEPVAMEPIMDAEF
jgi:hypothetical protein